MSSSQLFPALLISAGIVIGLVGAFLIMRFDRDKTPPPSNVDLPQLFGLWLPLVASVLMTLILISLGVSLIFSPVQTNTEIQMGLMLVFAVGVLLFLLFLMAAGFFSFFGSTNQTQALGLPDGSVRSLIALLLIVVFVIVSVYLFRNVAGRDGATLSNLKTADVVALGNRLSDIQQKAPDNFDATLRVGITDAGQQMGLQLATILGTLVTAVSSFYFGSTATASGASASGATTPEAEQTTLHVNPPTSQQEANRVLVLTGIVFISGMTVKLMQGANTIIPSSPPVVTPESMSAVFDLSDKPTGQWDVVVLFSDGTLAKSTPKGFQILP